MLLPFSSASLSPISNAIDKHHIVNITIIHYNHSSSSLTISIHQHHLPSFNSIIHHHHQVSSLAIIFRPHHSSSSFSIVLYLHSPSFSTIIYHHPLHSFTTIIYHYHALPSFIIIRHYPPPSFTIIVHRRHLLVMPCFVFFSTSLISMEAIVTLRKQTTIQIISLYHSPQLLTSFTTIILYPYNSLSSQLFIISCNH